MREPTRKNTSLIFRMGYGAGGSTFDNTNNNS